MSDISLSTVLLIKEKFDALSFYLNERALRIWCATEATNYDKTYGYGGRTAVHRATGVSYSTIRVGIVELTEETKLDCNKVRRSGGGRKKITDKYPNLLQDLESLVEPFSRGDPESALRWTCKSVRNLCEELNEKGYPISFRTICDLLSGLNYSLQANKKTLEGKNHPGSEFHLFAMSNGTSKSPFDTKRRNRIYCLRRLARPASATTSCFALVTATTNDSAPLRRPCIFPFP